MPDIVNVNPFSRKNLQVAEPKNPAANPFGRQALGDTAPAPTVDTQLKANLYQSTSVSPDAAVKQFSLNRDTKIPIDTIRRKQKEIERDYEFTTLNRDLEKLVDSPKLRETMKNPVIAPVIKDDLEDLSWAEMKTAETFREQAENIGTELAQERTRQEKARQLPILERLSKDYQQSAVLGSASVDEDRIARKLFWGEELTPTEQNRLDQMDSYKQTDYDIPFVLGIPSAVRQTTPLMIKALESKQALIGGAIGAATGAIIGGAGGTLVEPVGGTVAGAIAGARIGGQRGYSSGLTTEFMSQQGAGSFRDYMNVTDIDGKKIDLNIARGAAGLNGLIGGALEKMSFGVLAKNFPGAEKLMGKFSKESIEQALKSGVNNQAFERMGKAMIEGAATEGSTEFAQQVVQEVIKEAQKLVASGNFEAFQEDGSFYDWSAGVFERAAAAGKMGAQAGVGIAGTGQVASNVYESGRKRFNQVKETKNLKELVQNTKNNKTFQRDPKAWEAATENSLGEKQVYIPVESLREFFQSKKTEFITEEDRKKAEEEALGGGPQTIEEFLDLIPEAKEQYAEALQHGGNLVLPANKVISTIAQHEGLASLEEFLRVNPESLSDEQYTNEMLNKVLPELAELEKDTQGLNEKEEITRAFEDRLMNQGGWSPYVAKKIASIFGAGYGQLSKANQSPEIQEALKNIFRIEVRNQKQAEGIQKLRKVDQMDLMIDKAKKFKEKKIGKFNPKKSKMPLTDWMKGRGGINPTSAIGQELRAVGVDINKFPRIYSLTDGLKDIDNIPVSELQEAFPDAVIDQDNNGYVDRDFLIDAIANEHKGEIFGKIEKVDDAAAWVRDVRAEFDRRGLDITQMSNEQIRKQLEDIEKEYSTQAGGYGQKAQTKKVDVLVITLDKTGKLNEAGDPIFAETGTIESSIGGKEDITDLKFWNRRELERLVGVENAKAALDQMDKAKAESFNVSPKYGKAILKDVTIPNYTFFQSSKPTFYSSLEKNVEGIQQPKATPEQWKGIIKNLGQKGVKQEEIDWSGINEWLHKQEGSVTKEQIVDYIKANQLQVEEVLKGDGKELEQWRVIRPDGVSEGMYATEADAERKAETIGGIYEQAATLEGLIDTKFHKYQTPGGENYKELLIKLPVEKVVYTKDTVEPIDGADKARFWYFKTPDNVYQILKAHHATEEAAQEYIIKEHTPSQYGKEVYRTPHFDETNVVAHIRFNEREDAGGNKVLFIEEIQSDWHQAGRKKGYKKELEKLTDEELRTKYVDYLTTKKYSPYPQDIAELSAKDANREFLIMQLRSIETSVSNVPDAPFKTTWAELAFKRMLRYAVDKGINKVAWTTGEMQNQRYDLSKEIDRISVLPARTEGKYQLVVELINGDELEGYRGSGKEVTPQELEDTVGKDVAERAIKAANEKNKDKPYHRRDWVDIRGEGLKIGGDGMKGFYDRILPATVNKLAKKFGGKTETSEVTLSTDNEKPSFVVYNSEGTRVAAYKVEATAARDAEFINGTYRQDTPSVEVHSIEITPDMREAISKGLPLFQDHRGSMIFGAEGGSVLNMFEKADPSTVLHELMHFFLETHKFLENKFGDQLAPESKGMIEGMVKWWSSQSANIFKEAKKAEDTYNISDDGLSVTNLMGDTQSFETPEEAKTFKKEQEEKLSQHIESLGEDYIKTVAENFRKEPVTEAEVLIQREFHEYAARGFEKYLREGKAPSRELRDAFRAFKAWLIKVYKDVLQLNVNLNDDVRAVMDRLLASDEEIDAMRDEFVFRPDPQILENLSLAEQKDYIKRNENEIERGKEKLLSRLLRDLQRNHKDWYKKERAKVKSEVEKQVNESPLYKSVHFMRTGEFLNGDTPPGTAPFKMNIDDIRKDYELGDQIAARLPSGITGKDGLNPKVVATYFGFTDAQTMFDAMMNMPPRMQVIDQQTDQIMAERYGDALTDGTLEREALDAMHNTDRASKIAFEIGVINRKSGLKGVNKEQFRIKANNMIQDKQATRLNAQQYYVNEVSAAREAGKFLANKNFEKASEWKGKQLLNHYLYQEARAAEKARDRTYDMFDKVLGEDKDVSKLRDMDLVQAARAILGRYGYTKGTADVNVTLDQIKQYDPELYDRLIAARELVATPAKDYHKFTVAELEDVKNAVGSLWNLSRENFITDANGKKQTFAEARTKMIDRLREVYDKKDTRSYITATTDKERAQKGILSVMASLRITESWTSEVDNNDIDGIFSTTTSRPVQDAVSSYGLELQRQMKDYADIFKVLQGQTPKGTFRKAIAAPELTDEKGRTFKFDNKWQLLHAILHTGNSSNKTKLIKGYGWGEIREDGTVNTSKWDAFISRMENEEILTKQDYEFAQSIWDLMEQSKPLAQKAHKAQFGYYFKEITAEPVITRYGTFKGGYVPAIIDPTKTPDVGDKMEISDIMNNSSIAFSYPSPAKGFTYKRAEGYARPLQLDIRLLGSHIDKVLRFAYLAKPVSDIAKLYMKGTLRNEMDSINPGLIKNMIVPWLKRTANQVTQERGFDPTLDRIATTIRKRSGMAIMTLNFSNALQQLTGLSVAASQVNAGKLAASSASFGMNPNAFADAVNEKSDFMRLRAENQAFGLRADIDKMVLDQSTWDSVKKFGENHAYVLQRMMQNTVDKIVWQAAFDEAIENEKNEKSAVAHADSIVRQTQGSFEAQDLSKVTALSPFIKIFTQFLPYFNMLYNLNVKEARNIVRESGYKGSPQLFYLYMTTLAIPAIISSAIVMSMADAWDDDDEDMWMKLLVTSQVSTYANAIPLLGSYVNYGINLTDDKYYNDKFSVAPTFDMLANSIKAITDLTDDEPNAKALIRNGLQGIQLMTGQPVGFLGKPLGYLADVSSGKEDPSGPIDYTRGFITGKGNND